MKKSSGFTLIELVMTILIMALISTVIGDLMTTMIKGSELGFRIDELDWKVRESLERITREIREVNPNAITTMTSSQLVFTDAAGTNINYQFTSPSVTRNSQRLVTDVNSFAFTYLNESGTAAATASAVRYILVAVMFTMTDETGTTSTPIYYTTVAVRNGV